jgi:hypothetical protein
MPLHRHPTAIYPPLNTLKPVAENIWVVDGPVIGFGPGPVKMPFPTRMTVIRLSDGALLIHSPTELTGGLRAEIEALGRVAHIIAPNRIHYWWAPDWHRAWPDATVWLAPRIREQAGGRIDFEARELDRPDGYPWDDEITTRPVAGGYMTEVVFFHRATRTLVLTDLIENFEPVKLGWAMRWLTWLGGVLDPHGSMPRDMRMTFFKQRPQLKAAVEQMIGWDPERVIIAHGRWYARDGAAELKRAFRWLL